MAAGGVRRGNSQTPGTPPKRVDELIAYGGRSRFGTSIRGAIGVLKNEKRRRALTRRREMSVQENQALTEKERLPSSP